MSSTSTAIILYFKSCISNIWSLFIINQNGARHGMSNKQYNLISPNLLSSSLMPLSSRWQVVTAAKEAVSGLPSSERRVDGPPNQT